MTNLLLAIVLATFLSEPGQTPETTDQHFVDALCALKEAVRWQTPKWSEAMCLRVGNLILTEERKTGIPRNLILAVMLNESDMNENSQRVTRRGATIVARDGGLMGVRCRVGKDGKSCANYGGKITYQTLFKPEVNIPYAVKKLQATKSYPCAHTDHPWFAHYNWGGKVFRTGTARSYPQRIAVLWRALAQAQGVPQPELEHLRFVQIPGQKKVTIDTPVGTRCRDLVMKIQAAHRQVSRAAPSAPSVLATQ